MYYELKVSFFFLLSNQQKKQHIEHVKSRMFFFNICCVLINSFILMPTSQILINIVAYNKVKLSCNYQVCLIIINLVKKTLILKQYGGKLCN